MTKLHQTTSITFHGKTLAPGLGQGRVFLYRDDLTRFDEFYEIEEAAVEMERHRFSKAIKDVTADLRLLIAQVKKQMDANLAAIFEAHIVMLQDTELIAEVQREIQQQLVSAGSAVKVVFRRWERRFRAMEKEWARQKGDDMRDLMRRLLSSMSGTRGHALEGLPDGWVLVANRLLPSDTVFLGHRKASAAVVEVGGAASHAALFAREIGLPCLAGIPKLLDKVPKGALALVDADSAEVIINPSNAEKTAFRSKCKRLQLDRQRAQTQAHEPAITRDGVAIKVLANVGCEEDAREAVANGAEGVGLYRIERVYLGREKPPDTGELLAEMRQTLAPLKGLPVCVRLLDIGADKPLPFLKTYREVNPALGRRGIRFLKAWPNLLQTQLEALLQLAAEFELHILVPMVTLPDDLKVVRNKLTDIAAQHPNSTVPKLGAMIETPAAALAAAKIARYADFFSFGTNDLTQYSFAADRENAAVDGYFDDTHAAIFRLMRIVHEDVPQLPLCICGELASRPRHIERILQCGITSISVVSPAIATVKQAVRQANSRAH